MHYHRIDAIMRQLQEQGWMHHLARHSVACFLTRGDLWCSWEAGAKVFDRLLIDADWSINNANWMWLSASAFFTQYFRVYSPVAFGKQYDPQGVYIKRFVPELKVGGVERCVVARGDDGTCRSWHMSFMADAYTPQPHTKCHTTYVRTGYASQMDI